MTNRLARESSPYLLQHAENPVDWYAWGDEAFARARADDRPVLLSVGYSACHWCHVMAHESFENAETAALMNALFVSIKVDREERPDVDSVYMAAVHAMGVQGGWPLTVFLTPDGLPFFGGTYFPPEDRHGLRGFPHVLRTVARSYRDQRSQVDATGARVRDLLATPAPLPPGAPSQQLVAAAVAKLVEQTDRRRGGFGGAPKFPHPQALDLMLRRFAVTGEQAGRDAAAITLDAMARGGINDQVGGGFHRYSVDAQWAVPHFEKMLYDNAQLAPVYLHAYQLTGRDEHRATCTRTLDYMARELLLPEAGFAASQDADSPGGEGAFFVWTPAQLRAALGEEDGGFAARVFGVSDAGNFAHGATVLSLPYPLAQVARSMRVEEPAVRARVDRIRAVLYAARASRTAPARDGKVITAWNALAVSAFAEAGAALMRDDYLAIARRCADFLLSTLVRDGHVLRTWSDGEAKITGFLDDAAHLAAATTTVYECTGDPRYFDAAIQLAELVVSRYRDPSGMYFDTAAGTDPLYVRPRTVEDNPVTAGQSAAAAVFIRLHALTGEQRWEDRAVEIIAPLAAAVARAPLSLAGLGAAMDVATGRMREVAIAGEPDDPATARLVQAVLQRFDPWRVIAWGPPASVPLLRDRPLLDGRPAAYVCEGFVCERPVTDAESLIALLDATRARPQN